VQALAQQVGEQKWGEVVQRKGLLEALGGLSPCGEQSPRVVRQDIDVIVALADLGGQRPNVAHQREIGNVLMDRRASSSGLRLVRNVPDALRLAADECDLDTISSELDRGRTADSACGACEEYDGH